MTREELERRFIDAGWEIFDPRSPSEYPIIGNAGDLAITAHERFAESDDPRFELLARKRELSCWVRTVPTPQQAAELLEKHGRLPEEQWGNSYER